MKELITTKRFMGVGMRVHWAQGNGISAPSTSFYQIPIMRHVHSVGTRELDIGRNYELHIYDSFFNIHDKELKNFMCIATCLRIVRDLAMDRKQYGITKPIYGDPKEPRIIMNGLASYDDITRLRGMDMIDLICRTCGYRYTYEQVKKMSDLQTQLITLHSCLTTTDLLNGIAMRWSNAVNDIYDWSMADPIHRIQMRCSIQDNGSSYYFMKGAMNDPNFMDSKRYILDNSVFHAGAIGDVTPDDRLLTRIWLFFHKKCY